VLTDKVKVLETQNAALSAENKMLDDKLKAIDMIIHEGAK